MVFIRKALVGLAAALLSVTLFGFGFIWGVQQVLGTPDAIKQSLRDSNFYKDAVGAALDEAQKNQTKDNNQPGNPGEKQKENQIPVDQPAIRQIIQQAFPPEFLQTQTEQVIDSIYAWLNSGDGKLDFTIDLTDAKARLATGVGTYVQQHLSALPACTAANAPAPGQDVDVFNATCVPAGYDIAGAAAKASDQIRTGDFLKDPKITPGSIKVGDNQTLSDQLHPVPNGYQKAKQGNMAIGLVALLMATAIIFLSASRRSGIKRVAIIAIVNGAVITFLGFGSSFGVHRVSEELAKHQDISQAWVQKILSVVQLLVNDLRTHWLQYGIALLVLGIGTLVALHFLKPNAQVESKRAVTEDGEAPSEVQVSEVKTESLPVPPAPDKKPKTSGGKPDKDKKKLVQ